MTPEEFLRVALAAGANVRYADGAMEVYAPTEVTVTPSVAGPVAPPQEPTQKTEKGKNWRKNYDQFKLKFGALNAGVMASAIGVLIGAKTGDWSGESLAILAEADNVDLDVLRACSRVAIAYQHTVTRRKDNPPSMSQSALAAAMYSVLDRDPSRTQDEVNALVQTSGALLREVMSLNINRDEMGGARSMVFRRESYNRFLAVLLGKEE